MVKSSEAREKIIWTATLCCREIDIADVMRYPLSPIPLSLAHTDGTKHSTQKDRLRKILKGNPIVKNSLKAFISYVILCAVQSFRNPQETPSEKLRENASNEM